MAEQIPPPAPDQPKAAFRAWARGRLKALTAEMADAGSRAAAGHLSALLHAHPDALSGHSAAGAGVGNASSMSPSPAQVPGILLTYIPMRGEIDPIIAVLDAIKRDWAVAAPRCTGKSAAPVLQALPPGAIDGAASGAPTWNLADFEPDAWGIPAPRANVPVRPQAVTAVLVPGLAFDTAGHRIGRGAGVYDRLLATLPPTALRIGLVHSDRLVPALPHDAHDIAMHAIVTPDGTLRISG